MLCPVLYCTVVCTLSISLQIHDVIGRISNTNYKVVNGPRDTQSEHCSRSATLPHSRMVGPVSVSALRHLTKYPTNTWLTMVFSLNILMLLQVCHRVPSLVLITGKASRTLGLLRKLSLHALNKLRPLPCIQNASSSTDWILQWTWSVESLHYEGCKQN